MNSEGAEPYVYPFSLKVFGWWSYEQQPVGRGGVRGRRWGDTSSFWPGYSTGPDLLDFVGNTSQLSNSLCIANMILNGLSYLHFLCGITLTLSLPVGFCCLVARCQLPVGVFDGLDVIAICILLGSALIISA